MALTSKVREDWIGVGTVVRCRDGDRPDGEAVIMVPKGGVDGQDTSLRVGSRGVVIDLRPAEPPHRCANHDLGPDDCACGDEYEDAMIPGKDPCAVVEWSWDNGVNAAASFKTLRRRLVWPKDEGVRWQRVCSICGQPRTELREDGLDWTENGGRPAHKSCALGESAKALEQAGLRPREWKAGDAVWVPSGPGWRPGVVNKTSSGGWVYVSTWSKGGKVPSSTKPPAAVSTSRRGPQELRERNEAGERPRSDR